MNMNGCASAFQAWTRSLGRVAVALMLVFAAAFAVMAAMPQQASAMEVEACTAAPNEDGGDRILGAIDTRISWRAHSAADESVKAINLSTDKEVAIDETQVRVTAFSGLDRVELDPQATLVSPGVLEIKFAEAAPAGTSFLVEMYGVSFPAEGGMFSVSSMVTLDGGNTINMGEYPKHIDVAKVSLVEQMASWLEDQAWVKVWNSNKLLHMFLDPTLIVTSIPRIAEGWVTALAIVAISFPLAIPVAFGLALMRMARFRVLRGIGTTYVNVVRGTPMFLQIYIAFFGLPLAGVNIDHFALGCAVMILNSSAYLCEIFRAGIGSISKGQFEASRSLGMSGGQTMLFVIIPQAIRRVIPTMTNELILLYKDTSLLASVGIMETVMFAKTITAATGNITPYVVAAMFYLIVTLPMSSLTRRMEDKSSGRKVATRKKITARVKVEETSDWAPAVNVKQDELSIKTADL